MPMYVVNESLFERKESDKQFVLCIGMSFTYD